MIPETLAVLWRVGDGLAVAINSLPSTKEMWARLLERFKERIGEREAHPSSTA